MSLPQRLPLEQMQNVWATQLDPLLRKPLVQGLLLKNVALAVGTNSISHGLGRKLEGWNPTRVRAAAVIYDTQDSNPMPQLTLQLVSDVDVVIDLWVF